MNKVLFKIKDKFPIMLKSKIHSELKYYYDNGLENGRKSRQPEIDELLRDQKNELYLQHQEDTAELEILKDEIRELKKYIRDTRKQTRKMKSDHKKIKIIIKKFNLNFEKATNLLANLYGTFNGFNDEIELIEKRGKK